MTNEDYPRFYHKEPNGFDKLVLIILIALVAIFILCVRMGWCEEYPRNLWQGLIAEDTSGDYQTYLSIASVVRNRIDNGLNHGLIALKRQNLGQFVGQECAYALKIKKIDLTKLATKAIQEVFEDGKDYANGATHYEHTGVYSTPYWAKSMRIVKALYPNTRREITFYKQLARKR